MMNYELVDLNEKTVIGLTAQTSNSDENMPYIIGKLWQDFFQNGIFSSIENKVGPTTLEIYSDYKNKEKGSYQVTVGCEVSSVGTLQNDVIVKHIPKGRYAKFTVQGHMQQAIAAFWQELWTMDLDRAFTCDFEEYLNNDIENALVHIYIALK